MRRAHAYGIMPRYIHVHEYTPTQAHRTIEPVPWWPSDTLKPYTLVRCTLDLVDCCFIGHWFQYSRWAHPPGQICRCNACNWHRIYRNIYANPYRWFIFIIHVSVKSDTFSFCRLYRRKRINEMARIYNVKCSAEYYYYNIILWLVFIVVLRITQLYNYKNWSYNRLWCNTTPDMRQGWRTIERKAMTSSKYF